jgi:hypothetical protein
MRTLKLAIVFAAAFGLAVSAFGYDEDVDVTTAVTQVPATGVTFSNGTQTNFVKYTVTLTHYTTGQNESFGKVFFVADTNVSAPNAGPAAVIKSVSPPAVSSGPTLAAYICPITPPPFSPPGTPATHIECTFDFTPGGFNKDGATIRFDVTVQSPDVGTNTSGGTLNFNSTTSWLEPDEGNPREYGAPLQTQTALAVPDPKVVATYLPAPGTVTTGTTGGAATCVGGLTGNDPNKWVTIVKVPAAAQVGVNLNRDAIAGQVPQNAQFFSTISIPDLTNTSGTPPPQLFGVNPPVHWYDPGAANKLVVNTLRRDVCTVAGSTPLQKAAQILKEKIYYKPDGGTFQPVLLCAVTSGPTPNNPCIVFAQVYTQWTLPNVPNKKDYLGDHEWVIFANENGSYVAGD